MVFEEKHRWKKAKATWKKTASQTICSCLPRQPKLRRGKRLSFVVRSGLQVPSRYLEESHFPPWSPSRRKSLQGPPMYFYFLKLYLYIKMNIKCLQASFPALSPSQTCWVFYANCYHFSHQCQDIPRSIPLFLPPLFYVNISLFAPSKKTLEQWH